MIRRAMPLIVVLAIAAASGIGGSRAFAQGAAAQPPLAADQPQGDAERAFVNQHSGTWDALNP